MKYMCLIYHDEEKLESASPDKLKALVDGCGRWVEQLAKNGQHLFSAGLQSFRTGMTLQNRGGKVALTDGPFAETKEFLGGVVVFDARDLNEAVQLVSTFPALDIWTLEVRPVLDPHAQLADPLDRKLAAVLRGNPRMTSVVAGSAGKEFLG